LVDMAEVFMIGTRPRFRLKIRVELSAFFTASLNFFTSGLTPSSGSGMWKDGGGSGGGSGGNC
jgi:hypothetical protein